MNNATADPCQYIMPIGRFEGRPISTIEPGYLRWLIAESAAEPSVRQAARQELLRRARRALQQAEGVNHGNAN